GTNSRLEEHAIHLSSASRSDSIPGLQIDANDVKAGHASTSGQIEEEQLFYMLSRGIKRDDAIHMIVTGFFEPVLDRIPLEDLPERGGGLIEAKFKRAWGGAGAAAPPPPPTIGEVWRGRSPLQTSPAGMKHGQ